MPIEVLQTVSKMKDPFEAIPCVQSCHVTLLTDNDPLIRQGILGQRLVYIIHVPSASKMWAMPLLDELISAERYLAVDEGLFATTFSRKGRSCDAGIVGGKAAYST